MIQLKMAILRQSPVMVGTIQSYQVAFELLKNGKEGSFCNLMELVV